MKYCTNILVILTLYWLYVIYSLCKITLSLIYMLKLTRKIDEKLLDEKMLNERQIKFKIDNTEENFNLKEIITMYRNLRENYEYSLRYEEADKFFIREMELKRKYCESNKDKYHIINKNSWFKKNFSLTGLYRITSEYGQSYTRPAILSIFVLLIPLIYSLIQQYPDENVSFDKVMTSIDSNFKDIFNISEKQSTIGYFINFLTIPALGALLWAALRRRFEKRFRRLN